MNIRTPRVNGRMKSVVYYFIVRDNPHVHLLERKWDGESEGNEN